MKVWLHRISRRWEAQGANFAADGAHVEGLERSSDDLAQAKMPFFGAELRSAFHRRADKTQSIREKGWVRPRNSGRKMSEKDQNNKGSIGRAENGYGPNSESPKLEVPQEPGDAKTAEEVQEERPPIDPPHGVPEQLLRLSLNGLSTETIDLNGLFTKDITDSGSFDIRGDIWRTTFGRVPQALPIAALMVAPDLSVTVANEACRRITSDYEDILGSPFSDLFPTESGKTRAHSVIQAVFADRRPRVLFGMLDICKKRVWGRATLRSIRIIAERYVPRPHRESHP